MFKAELWRSKYFPRFFIGAAFSRIGDWFNTVAMSVLVYQLTGRVSLVAATIAVSVLPRILVGPIGGDLADRFERRRLLITLDATRCAIALAPLFVHHAQDIWIVYLTVALLQTCSALYNPAEGAYIPRLVTDNLLAGANAAHATMSDLGMFVGPTLATVVLQLWGPSSAFLLNSLSFATVALLLLRLPKTTPHSTAQADVRRETLLNGYVNVVRQYPWIASLCVSYIALSIPVFYFQGIVVAYARMLGEPSRYIGILYGAAGIGGAVGAIGMGHLLHKVSYRAAIAVFALALPLLATLPLVHSSLLALAILASSTAAGTVGDIIFALLVQKHVESQQRGKAFALCYWCIALGQLMGATLGIASQPQLAVHAMLYVSLLCLPVAVGGALISVRHRTQPAQITQDSTVQVA